MVGVGASAGGIEAFKALLGALPPDTGMAFVFILHLAPTHASMLAHILARETRMPVSEVQDEPEIMPDRVYVIPPGRAMIVRDGRLHLISDTDTPRHPVDRFLSSLADDRGHLAVGVVLSGTGADGTLGLAAVKAVGGITFAQDASAQHDGMPRSAIASSCVDFVLPPASIAAELGRLAHHPYVRVPSDGDVEIDEINQILEAVRQSNGVDFSQYKSSTLHRRIRRRMALHKLTSFKQYAAHLKVHPDEAEALYQDILINVTNFFRTPEAFEVLKANVLPKLFKNRSRQDPVRVWVLGCSTGEEAYSLAILLAEYIFEAHSPVPVCLYATDINSASIERARTGLYPKSIAEEVSPERLRRFFVEVDGGYRVAKSVRDMCIFARQNVLTDPPFSRMDIVSCRNVMIYMEGELQKKLLHTLHYALKPTGYLFLGPSETIGSSRELFEPDDSKHKIFARRAASLRPEQAFPVAPYLPLSPERRPERWAEGPRDPQAEIQREADRVLLSRYVPAGVRCAAGSCGERAVSSKSTQPESTSPARGGRTAQSKVLKEKDEQISRLTQELAATRDYLQSVIEQQEAANEELQSANEELQSANEEVQSANEELQSINEELETSKEEIQSSNEELRTVNDELHNRNEELSRLNDDLNNLHSSVEIAIVMVWQDLRIRRFTPLAEKHFNLIATDIGRPIGDIKLNLNVHDLPKLLSEAIDSVTIKEMEVQDLQGRWYLLRVRPYRTQENKIDGAVVVLIDIQALKANQEVLERQGKLLEQTHEAIFARELGGEIFYWNRGAELLYGHTRAEAVGHSDPELLGTDPGRRESVDQALAAQGHWEGELERRTRGGRPLVVESTQVIVREVGRTLVLETNHDVTERKRLEQNLKQRVEELAAADRRKNEFLALLAHELRNPLVPLRNAVHVLKRSGTDTETGLHARELIERQLAHMTRLIDDLLDASRISRGQVQLQLEPVELQTLVQRAVETTQQLMEEHHHRLDVDMAAAPIVLVGDATRLEQVFGNLLTNAAKYTPAGGKISVKVEVLNELGSGPSGPNRRAVVRIRDSGIGIEPEMLPRIFDLFAQGDQSLGRMQGGLGIGLSIVRSLVELHGGTVNARSDGPGHGNEFVVELPLDAEPRSAGEEEHQPREAHTPSAQADAISAGNGVESSHAEHDPESGPNDHPNGAATRVLVVDDNADIAESTSLILRLAGYTVKSVLSGQDAIAVGPSFRPSIVLLDIGMPGLDGYAVARRFRREPRLKDTVLIAMTGYGTAGDRARTKEAGFDQHLVKPVDPAALQQLITDLSPC